MNSKSCRRLLEDYHDGELAGQQAGAVEDHLKECSTCAAELRALETESDLFERYRVSQEEEMAAAPAKWDQVRSRIAREGGSAAPRWESKRDRHAVGLLWLRFLPGSPLLRQALFASVLIALSVSGTLVFVNQDRPKTADPVMSAKIGKTEASLPVALDSNKGGLESAMRAVRRAEQEYLQAIQVLSEIVDRRKPTLSPVLVQKIERNLKAIDENIAATRRAYYAQPSDPELAQYMLAAYSKKVELLQELAT